MTLEQLEAEVLTLPKDAQMLLLARLLERLGQNIDPDLSDRWVEEAARRDQVMDAAQSVGIPAEDVFQRVRASLQ